MNALFINTECLPSKCCAKPIHTPESVSTASPIERSPAVSSCVTPQSQCEEPASLSDAVMTPHYAMSPTLKSPWSFKLSRSPRSVHRHDSPYFYSPSSIAGRARRALAKPPPDFRMCATVASRSAVALYPVAISEGSDSDPAKQPHRLCESVESPNSLPRSSSPESTPRMSGEETAMTINASAVTPVTGRQPATLRLPAVEFVSPQGRGQRSQCLPGVFKRQKSDNDTPPAMPMLPGVFNRSRNCDGPLAAVRSAFVEGAEEQCSRDYVTDTMYTPSLRKRPNYSPRLEVQTPTVMLNADTSGSGRRSHGSIRHRRSCSPDSVLPEQHLAWAPSSFVQSFHEGFDGSPQASSFGGKYTFVRQLGRGSQGTVFVAAHTRTHKEYACKVVAKQEGGVNLRREIALLCILDHPNIIRLYETFEDMDSVYLLMELTQSGDLFDLIQTQGPIKESSAKMYTRQLLSALAYCHAHGVAHMDIKPENVLIEGNHVKLVDFGIAKKFRSFQKASRTDSSLLGSASYMAPELLDDEIANKDPSSLFASDCWSLGCVIYVMLTATLPFGNQYHPSKELRYSFTWGVMPEAQELVSQLLAVDPSARIMAQQALSCAWFTGLVQPPSPGSTRSALVPMYSPNRRRGNRMSAKKKKNGQRRRTNRLNVPPLASSTSTATSSTFTPSPSQEERLDSLVKAQEMASWILESLREWAKIPRLVRIVKACIARRLEAEFTEKARYGFAFLSETNGFSGGAISRPKLENALQRALRGPGYDYAGSPKDCEFDAPRANVCRLQNSTRRSSLPNLSWEEREQLTGKCPENTSFVPIFVSHDEMRYLVEKLDGSQNGYVDYTLFVACVLDPAIFQDEDRIREAFELFDLRQQGKIVSDDFRRVMHRSPRESNEKHHFHLEDTYKEMLAPFDMNKDGGIDLEEFKAMVLGTEMATPAHTLTLQVGMPADFSTSFFS